MARCLWERRPRAWPTGMHRERVEPFDYNESHPNPSTCSHSSSARQHKTIGVSNSTCSIRTSFLKPRTRPSTHSIEKRSSFEQCQRRCSAAGITPSNIFEMLRHRESSTAKSVRLVERCRSHEAPDLAVESVPTVPALRPAVQAITPTAESVATSDLRNS